MISYMKIMIPIVYVKKTNLYFVGTKQVRLHLKGAFIHVQEELDSDKTIRFNQYISDNQSLFAKELTFYQMRSKWEVKQIVQALIDGKKIDNVSDKDLKIFRSYALGNKQKSGNVTLSQKI